MGEDLRLSVLTMVTVYIPGHRWEKILDLVLLPWLLFISQGTDG